MLYGWKENSRLTHCLAACTHLTITVSEIKRGIGRKSYLRKQTNFCFNVMQNLGIWGGSWGGVKMLSSKLSYLKSPTHILVFTLKLKGCNGDSLISRWHILQKCRVFTYLAFRQFWDPYLFLQPLKLATSNLVHNLVSTSSMPKTTFGTKIGVGVG